MARKVTIELVDDYDNQSAAEETVCFAVDGVSYEIDLSVLNGAELRDVFERWTSHARRTSSLPRGKAQARPASDRAESYRIREWARTNGMTVSRRGRISAELAHAYQIANK
ncbi:Lsr2 family protein [Nocardia sp. NPDC005366]|uniref:histone-like nucleoid-structuring protein Lsr2 n=1 Tax=Nocardia sp. NPDC005366 TaxID=3156878 RepID=UPI0033B4E2B3